MDDIDECTNCDEGSAEYQCNTCQVSLCQTCRDRHKRKKGTSHHDVIKNSFCQVHTNKVYISCCKQCEVPVCMTCMRESHFGHEQTDIDQIFESKLEEFLTVFKCLKDTFTNSTELATKIEQDERECEDEISEIQSKINSRAQAIKDAMDIILHDNKENLTAMKSSLMSEFQTHKAILSDFISKIKYLLKKYKDVESTELPAEFIITHREKVDAMKKMMDIPKLPGPLMPCYEQNVFQQSDIERLLPRVSYLGIACRERSPRNVSTETYSERSPVKVTTERSPDRVTTDGSPKRMTTKGSTERVTTEQSPNRVTNEQFTQGKVTTDQSPERLTTEQSPVKVTTERSPERATAERSPERVTTERSPERVTTERSPERATTEGSLERVTTERSPDSLTTEQSQEMVTTEQSSERTTTERSPGRVTTERSAERKINERSPDRLTTERSTERVTTERSPERVSSERSPERVTTERSPERGTTERSPERMTTGRSTERAATERSPERVPSEQFTERATTEHSSGRIETERSPEKVTTERPTERVTTERSPERVTTERSPERKTNERSPDRVTTERSPERVTTERSAERVTTDLSTERRTTERSPERVISEQSTERVTTEHSSGRMATERSPERVTTGPSPERVTTERSPERVITKGSPERVTAKPSQERLTTKRSSKRVKTRPRTTERSSERVTTERSQGRVTTERSPDRVATELSFNPLKEALNVSDKGLGKNCLELPGIKSIYHISWQVDKKFWVSNNAGDLVLTDFSGQEYKKIKTSKGTGYHAVLNTGDLIIADVKDGLLKTVGLNKIPVPLIKPFLEIEMKPLGVFVNPLNNSILVGMKQGYNTQVVRFNYDWEIIKRIQYDSEREPLYKYPHYITENNKNGDICVSDYDSRAVVVVNYLGNHRFTYTGHPRGTLGYPYGICCDAQGCILFCDSMNYKIHLIDMNGTFLSFTLTQGIGRPHAICVDGNRDIWLGAQGKECIMKLKVGS